MNNKKAKKIRRLAKLMADGKPESEKKKIEKRLKSIKNKT